MIARTLLISSMLLLSSCAALREHERERESEELHASLLAYVPEGERAPIQEARARRAQVTEDLRIAESDLKQLESRLQLARHELEVVEQRVKEAETRIDHTRRFGNQHELEEARRQRVDASNALRFAQGKIRYYEDLEELGKNLERLHEARVELADATVELEEAVAVARLDRPAAREVDVQLYERRVAELHDEVAMHDVEARASRMKVELGREFLYERAQAVPASFRLSEPEAPETVLTLPPPSNGPWGAPRGVDRRRDMENQPSPPPQDQPPQP